MGLYEAWNPLLYGVHPEARNSIVRLTDAVQNFFQLGGLEIALQSQGQPRRFGWDVSNFSPVYGGNAQSQRKKAQETLVKRMAGDNEDYVKFLMGDQNRGWWGMAAGQNTEDYVEDKKLVVSFRVPGIERKTIQRLRQYMVDNGLAQNTRQIADGVTDVEQPHIYMSASLERDDERVAGRLVREPNYLKPKEEALWFSTARKKHHNGHWLFYSKDILVEMRIEPQQSYMRLGYAIIELGYVLAGQKVPEQKDVFLHLWHTVLPKLIDSELISHARLPGQQVVFDVLLVNTIFPYLTPGYAELNRFRPYNAMVFGSKGVGKTMLAAMLAVERFEHGVVMPMSQELLLNDESGIFSSMKYWKERTGIRFIPVIEDLDRIASLPSDKIGSANSDLANLLAGMGAERPVIIGTGNNPQTMDPNMLEPERLGGLMLWLKLPDEHEREMLLRNAFKGKALEDGLDLDYVVQELVKGTNEFSHRMVIDVSNRSVTFAADRRLNGSLGQQQYDGKPERISIIDLKKAVEYGWEYYQFAHLGENEESINKFFSQRLGNRNNNRVGFHQQKKPIEIFSDMK